MKELQLKKCLKCGAIVKIINDCQCQDCSIICCHEKMKEIKANTTDAAIEKHKPNYAVVDDQIEVTVNHVMDDDHYIEWVCLLTDDREEYVYFTSQDKPKANFAKVKTGIIYSYCNKHGLWKEEIKG